MKHQTGNGLGNFRNRFLARLSFISYSSPDNGCDANSSHIHGEQLSVLCSTAKAAAMDCFMS